MKKFFKGRFWLNRYSLLVITLITLVVVFNEQLLPIKEVLSSPKFSFNIGSRRFSLYLLAKVLFIIVVLLSLAGMLSEFGVKRISSLKGIKPRNKLILSKTYQIGLYILTLLTGLDLLGIDLATLTIFSGAIGIGLGFGLQKITANFISGLILFFEKSVENDDLVELSDGVYGFVRYTKARYTLVETLEGKEIMIPNEEFISNRVTNWTYTNSQGRVEVKVGVSYDSDIEKVKDLILQSAIEHPRCATSPAPSCYLCEFADSSINFILFFWVEDVTLGRYEPRSDVMFKIWNKFKKNGIKIPFPQRDLHINYTEVPK